MNYYICFLRGLYTLFAAILGWSLSNNPFIQEIGDTTFFSINTHIMLPQKIDIRALSLMQKSIILLADLSSWAFFAALWKLYKTAKNWSKYGNPNAKDMLLCLRTLVGYTIFWCASLPVEKMIKSYIAFDIWQIHISTEQICTLILIVTLYLLMGKKSWWAR